MNGFVRRVVTGHDADGRAIVLSDGLTPTLKTNPLRPGHKSTEVWRTNQSVPHRGWGFDCTPVANFRSSRQRSIID